MDTKWVRSADVAWEELGREALLVSAETGARWSLNAAATRVWKACDGTLGLSELARASGLAEFEKVAEFCSAFAQMGLLRGSSQLALASAGTRGGGAVFMSGLESPAFRALGVGASGPRRRPSPRGNSGPG